MSTYSATSLSELSTAMPPYAIPNTAAPVDLRLDANEGPASACDAHLLSFASALGPEALRRYPDSSRMEALIGQRWGVGPSRVLVTAGADEAIDRTCRALLAKDRELILPTPSFEMIARYARLAGAEIVTTPWPQGPYPVDGVLSLINDRTSMIAVVSPNNPTGATATVRDLERLAAAAPRAALLVDAAYAEFADEDLTAAALGLSRAVIIRTFSKAYAMAGLRVGYAIGAETIIGAMRAAGSPFPVPVPSLLAAEGVFGQAGGSLSMHVSRVRLERDKLGDTLAELGAQPRPSQGNFVLADFADPEWVWRALAGLGIGVRRFRSGLGLERSLRITCPGHEAGFERLCRGLRAALRPRALLVNVDSAIPEFAVSLGRTATSCAETSGVRVGSAGTPPSLAETPATDERCVLERLARRLPLVIMSTHPEGKCEETLRRLGLTPLSHAAAPIVSVPADPDPAVLRGLLARLGVDSAWMVGGKPNDVISARAAGVVPIGVSPPGDLQIDQTLALERVGAARVLSSLDELEEMLP